MNVTNLHTVPLQVLCRIDLLHLFTDPTLRVESGAISRKIIVGKACENAEVRHRQVFIMSIDLTPHAEKQHPAVAQYGEN